MKKYCKALANITVAAIILIVIIAIVPKILIFFMPFVVGWIIALLASPPVRFLEEKLKLKRNASSAFVIIAVIALVILVIYLVGAKLAEELVGFIGELPEMWESVKADFTHNSKNFALLYQRLPLDIRNSISDFTDQIGTYTGEAVSTLSAPTISAVGNFAKRLPATIIGIIMALLSSYFFVAQRGSVTGWVQSHMPPSLQAQYQMIKRSLVVAVGGYFKAQLRIEVWMYLLLVIGLSILRVDYVLLIALGIALLDFFPFFGTGTVMIPWAIIKILSGDYSKAIGLLIIWGVGQLARQLIQPKIVGDSVGVPPIPTLFLLYIGYQFGGVFGMIVAVPIGLIVITMYKEGAFDTTKNSVLILISGINKFRKLEKEDMVCVEQMRTREEELGQRLAKQSAEKNTIEKKAMEKNTTEKNTTEKNAIEKAKSKKR